MENFSFARALSALENALTFGVHPSLEGIRALTEALGRPQETFASVQVTGTNGKSSVTRMISAILNAHGLVAGAYTSPHLHSYTERMEIAGSPVSERAFASAVQEVLQVAQGVRDQGYREEFTEFELLTAAALLLFRTEQVDAAVLEVGMGGRWDATSVVTPAVAVVTGVAVDHVAHLGGTRQEIAEDKAHIIGPGSTAILGPGTNGVEQAFLEHARMAGAQARAVRALGDPSPVIDELTVRYRVERTADEPEGATGVEVIGLHGHYPLLSVVAPGYQGPNVATAVAAAEATLGRKLDSDLTRDTLAEIRFPGRFEVVSRAPLVVVDGAHNPQAAAVLAQAVRECFPAESPQLLLGVLADKDAEGIVRELMPVAASISVAASPAKRALSADALAEAVTDAVGYRPAVFPDVATGLTALGADSSASILVTGSITMAAEARRLLLGGYHL